MTCWVVRARRSRRRTGCERTRRDLDELISRVRANLQIAERVAAIGGKRSVFIQGFGLQTPDFGQEMSRDHTMLRVFSLADELLVAVYGATARFPSKTAIPDAPSRCMVPAGRDP